MGRQQRVRVSNVANVASAVNVASAANVANVDVRDNTGTAGSFDRRKLNGRKKGVPNKVGKLLKDAIILAAEEMGDMEVGYRYNKKTHIWKKGKGGLLGYLKWMARNEPRSFATLLSRVIPLHMVAEHDHNHRFESQEELLERLHQLGIDPARLFPGRTLPTTLELTAQDVTDAPVDEEGEGGEGEDEEE